MAVRKRTAGFYLRARISIIIQEVRSDCFPHEWRDNSLEILDKRRGVFPLRRFETVERRKIRYEHLLFRKRVHKRLRQNDRLRVMTSIG
ncbi:hypothetical protein TNCV_2132121 [Trichonephila clavipes]|nr:hypothetical protein TNCV_2132121 [Trichonephila clavipes]